VSQHPYEEAHYFQDHHVVLHSNMFQDFRLVLRRGAWEFRSHGQFVRVLNLLILLAPGVGFEFATVGLSGEVMRPAVRVKTLNDDFCYQLPLKPGG